VVEALGYGEGRSMGSVRFSFGRETDKVQIKRLLVALKDVVKFRA
jgi:cysteine sulfinate desulfinase/cysteine desulfurase-like protein